MTKSRGLRLGAALVGILAAGGLGLISATYQRDISKARHRIAAGSQIMQTACGPIEYAEAGTGPPLLGGRCDRRASLTQTPAAPNTRKKHSSAIRWRAPTAKSRVTRR